MNVKEPNGSNGFHKDTTERPLHGRESTFESADQAAGIYSLYGGDGGDTRDSWRSSIGSTGPENTNGRVPSPSGPRTPLRNSFTQNDTDGLGPSEELGVEHETHGLGEQFVSNGATRSSISDGSQVRTPDIRITPSKTNGAHEQDRRSTLSTATTPTHPNLSRLSPRHPLGGSTTSATSSASTSVLSYAGSSQYPGEEEDAFRVRSTCAFPKF